MLLSMVLLCEVLFWVFLLGGLSARYLLGRARLGAALLVAAPLVDLVLLAASVADLRAGAVAGASHVLAAVYLGASVGFGHRLVKWADVRFAHRVGVGPAPQRPPRGGRAHARAERSGWYAHVRAWAVGSALMVAAVVLVDDPARTQAFNDALRLWLAVVAVDGLWSVSYTVLPRREGPREAPHRS